MMKKYIATVMHYDLARGRLISWQTVVPKLLKQVYSLINKSVLKYLAIIYVVAAIFILPSTLQKIFLSIQANMVNKIELTEEQYASIQQQLNKEISQLDKTIESKNPKGYYLIVNTSSNEFSLLKGREIIKKDKCSTGSYVLLKNGENQKWMFKTPKGEFKIQYKKTSPVWKKPDWAFIEEGLPVPPPNHHSRFEYGVLGDYALSLGQGYLIHGTLFQRFLGLPVTHGCIRLNDENLELVYKSLKVGSKVYIY